jgi:pimeloyl-ACP methyl ester carboxylesterase
MSRFTESDGEVDRPSNDTVRDEVTHWFFDDYLPTYIGVASGAIPRGPEFILDYWGVPLHASTPTAREWFLDKDAVSGYIENTHIRLRAQGYAYTAVLDRKVTIYHDAGAAIEVIWSRCRSDHSEIERLAVHFEIARTSAGWRVVGLQAMPTAVDSLAAAWQAQARPDDNHARHSGGLSGDGITGDLVFIHGFLDTAALWQQVIDRLECPEWTPIPVSLHHTGLREPLRRGATLEAYRDQVDAGLDRPTIVIGHSMGTQIAELLTVARQHRTVGLVLISPIPLRGFALSAADLSAFEAAARTREPNAAADGRKPFLVSRSPEVINALTAGTLGTPPEMALEELHAWTAGHPLGDAPSMVTVPTLIITSDDTFATRALVREQVASRFAHCEIVYVPGAGHWPHAEQPADVARIITTFVKRVAASLSKETEKRS